MSKRKNKNAWHFRPLLTETLPYELPVIFGNEGLYYGRGKKLSNEAEILFRKLYEGNDKYTIPYNYSIKKDSTRQTLLSLAHPSIQLEFCDFYSQYENSILDNCRRSLYSLRHPAAIAAVYVTKMNKDDVVHKVGQIELVSNDIEVELSRLVSYFSYEKYSLLNKFYESREFIRLEKRFERLRQIDISKCFYGIYTHSISWSTRGKEFAKSNTSNYHFESAFDSLMQRANHNETNGILVGPEISRIFAEIILQGIDFNVHKNISEILNLSEGKDYAIRRYVDDFSIFSNSEQNLNNIEKIIRDELTKFKLHVNESKVRNLLRPFVTPLSQARADLRVAIFSVKKIVATDNWKNGSHSLVPEERHSFKNLLNTARTIVHKYNIEFGHISGSFIGDLRSLVRLANFKTPTASPDWESNWRYAISKILECAFYVAAVDLRVRTTYGICQLLSLVNNARPNLSDEAADEIAHFTAEELTTLCRAGSREITSKTREDIIELYNALICGTHNIGTEFLKSPEISKILHDLLSGEITYFKYISLKFCFLKDISYYRKELDTLNSKAEMMISKNKSINQCSENFHLFCDLLSAPDLSSSKKLEIFKSVFGGSPTKATIDELAKVIGFVDWNGIAIEHTLRRRQMRPVYAVA